MDKPVEAFNELAGRPGAFNVPYPLFAAMAVFTAFGTAIASLIGANFGWFLFPALGADAFIVSAFLAKPNIDSILAEKMYNFVRTRCGLRRIHILYRP